MALWAAVIIGREIAVSALREWMAEVGKRARVSVATVGKIKTVVQMVALVCLLYAVSPDRGCLAIPGWVGRIIFAGCCGRALLTLWSGLEYLRAAWPALREQDPTPQVDRGVPDA
jgi:CDP-diacylglycerol---glycerol-3-phosphate 3-phosphatidyltransferase